MCVLGEDRKGVMPSPLVGGWWVFEGGGGGSEGCRVQDRACKQQAIPARVSRAFDCALRVSESADASDAASHTRLYRLQRTHQPASVKARGCLG
jgi:hypothetical protein